MRLVIRDYFCSSGSHRRHPLSSIVKIRQTKTSPSRSWWLTWILAVSVSCHVSCHMCTSVRLCGTYYAQLFHISRRSPLSFPPKNARVNLTTMRYGLASCKLLWHVCAFNRHATRILIKKSCSNILNIRYGVPKHTWCLTSLEDTSNRSQIHANGLTHAARVTLRKQHVHCHETAGTRRSTSVVINIRISLVRISPTWLTWYKDSLPEIILVSLPSHQAMCLGH